MEREDVAELGEKLRTSRFACVPDGTHSLDAIYDFVKAAHPTLCDDSFLGSDATKKGHSRPQWEQKVRSCLWHACRKPTPRMQRLEEPETYEFT